jgi:hypothetical protein
MQFLPEYGTIPNNLKKERYSDIVRYAYENRQFGEYLDIDSWVRQFGSQYKPDIYSKINLYIRTGTMYELFELDPNLREDWYLKLRKDIASSIGAINVILKYNNKELNNYSLEAIASWPKYSIKVDKRDDLGRLPDLSIVKRNSIVDNQRKEINRSEELLVKAMTESLKEKTEDMTLEEMINFFSKQPEMVRTVSSAIRNPICYDSKDNNAYKIFMKKYNIDPSELCNDISQKVMGSLCGCGIKKKKKKDHKKGYPVKIGSFLESENPEKAKYDEIHNILIGSHIFDCIRCKWDHIWKCKEKKCKPSRKHCDYKSAYSSSSSSESHSSDNYSSYSSSDDDVNKYTATGYLSIRDPFKNYYQYNNTREFMDQNCRNKVVEPPLCPPKITCTPKVICKPKIKCRPKRKFKKCKCKRKCRHKKKCYTSSDNDDNDEFYIRNKLNFSDNEDELYASKDFTSSNNNNNKLDLSDEEDELFASKNYKSNNNNNFSDDEDEDELYALEDFKSNNNNNDYSSDYEDESYISEDFKSNDKNNLILSSYENDHENIKTIESDNYNNINNPPIAIPISTKLCQDDEDCNNTFSDNCFENKCPNIIPIGDEFEYEDTQPPKVIPLTNINNNFEDSPPKIIPLTNINNNLEDYPPKVIPLTNISNDFEDSPPKVIPLTNINNNFEDSPPKVIPLININNNLEDSPPKVIPLSNINNDLEDYPPKVIPLVNINNNLEDSPPKVIPLTNNNNIKYNQSPKLIPLKYINNDFEDSPPKVIALPNINNNNIDIVNAPRVIPLSSINNDFEDSPSLIEASNNFRGMRSQSELFKNTLENKQPPKIVPIKNNIDFKYKQPPKIVPIKNNVNVPHELVKISNDDDYEDDDDYLSTISYDKIKTDGSNFMDIYHSAKNNPFKNSEYYRMFIPTNKSLNKSISKSFIKQGGNKCQEFIQNYISSTEHNDFDDYNENGELALKTIGNRIFNYNPLKSTVNGNSSKFKVYGTVRHPNHKNVELILQDALHTRMKLNKKN